MPKQICRGRSFWTPLVEEFDGAGATERHKQFAARHEVRCSSFETWLYRLRAEGGARPQRRASAKHSGPLKTTRWPLVEVQGLPIGDSRFEVELPGGRRLRVPAWFDAEALRRLLKLLSEAVS
jgi:hypothetical protein